MVGAGVAVLSFRFEDVIEVPPESFEKVLSGLSDVDSGSVDDGQRGEDDGVDDVEGVDGGGGDAGSSFEEGAEGHHFLYAGVEVVWKKEGLAGFELSGRAVKGREWSARCQIDVALEFCGAEAFRFTVGVDGAKKTVCGDGGWLRRRMAGSRRKPRSQTSIVLMVSDFAAKS